MSFEPQACSLAVNKLATLFMSICTIQSIYIVGFNQLNKNNILSFKG